MSGRLKVAEVRVLDAAHFLPCVAAAAVVYGQAMQRNAATVAARRDLIRTHVDRPGFVAVAVFDADTLVGFGYGYQGRSGQWWHDVVAAALGRDAAGDWLGDAFELAELHIAPSRQGEGLGRRTLECLLGVAEGHTVVLSTPDRTGPARSLYRSVGFVDLLEGFRFPGSAELYAVMGLRRSVSRPPGG